MLNKYIVLYCIVLYCIVLYCVQCFPPQGLWLVCNCWFPGYTLLFVCFLVFKLSRCCLTIVFVVPIAFVDFLFTCSLGPEVIKLFSCTTQLSTKLILLINVKMPRIVGILTFISRINTTSVRPKARNFFICRYFCIYEQLKFRAHLS